ncbi:MAG: prefoldin subunit alpha, partial [Candidatus Altiarchaeota archaeon]|nr:prefoldin subunit alpha [Candidatus Altiarchaeota archaeon]
FMNQQIQSLQMRMLDVEKTAEELSVLKVGLTNMEDVAVGDDILIPLGASVYTRGKVSIKKKVIVNIGAGVFVEKDIKDALPLVDKQIDAILEQQKMIVENINALSKEAERLTAEVNTEVMAMQNVGLPT